jgi:hypothetical protein
VTSAINLSIVNNKIRNADGTQILSFMCGPFFTVWLICYYSTNNIITKLSPEYNQLKNKIKETEDEISKLKEYNTDLYLKHDELERFVNELRS